jgi:DNA modification methylase
VLEALGDRALTAADLARAAGVSSGVVKGLVDEDETPDPPVAPLSKPGDIWLLGEHRVMCGDSTDQGAVVALMAGEKADMVFTDPPYGVSYADKNKYLNSISSGNRIQKNIENDHMTLSETSDFIYKSFCSIKLILAKRSSYYITAPQGGDLLMTMMMKSIIIVLKENLTFFWNMKSLLKRTSNVFWKKELHPRYRLLIMRYLFITPTELI